MRLVGRFVRRGGVIVCYLGMLAGLLGVALLMGFGSFPVRFGGLVMVSGGFVVVVFRHGYFRAFRGPIPPPCFGAPVKSSL
jgi:hypothetical protein